MEQKGVEEVLVQYYSYLKEVYMTVASRAKFPYISLLNLSEFCEACNINDKHLTLSIIDT